MVDELSVHQARFLRTGGQLLRESGDTVFLPAAVRSLVGINAQRTSAMFLALRARLEGVQKRAIEEAINLDRSLVRTWAMRGTIHLLAADDVEWLVSTLAPTLIAKGSRRMAELGLDESLAESGVDKIRAALRVRAEPLTRRELMDALAGEGIELDSRTQAPIHLIRHAALTGLLCMGPERENGEATYVLRDEWIGGESRGTGGSGLAELAMRYLDCFAPATTRDFAMWSGLTAAEAKEALRGAEAMGKLAGVKVEKVSMWLPVSKAKILSPSRLRKSTVKLLPAFDTYLLGYADRSLLVSDQHRKDVYHGGQTLPVVLVDGAAAGTWRYERRGKRLAIEVKPFERLDDTSSGLVAEEAEDVARFLGLPATLCINGP
ncbi:MAG: winged helix DNA-binding domain-containing protein [Actinomycetota bacterium]